MSKNMKFQVDKEEIEKKLVEKGATQPCHRCGHSKFSILEGATNIQLHDSLELDGSFVLGGGASMPVVYIACVNCGALTLHAAGGLGLINFKGK